MPGTTPGFASNRVLFPDPLKPQRTSNGSAATAHRFGSPDITTLSWVTKPPGQPKPTRFQRSRSSTRRPLAVPRLPRNAGMIRDRGTTRRRMFPAMTPLSLLAVSIPRYLGSGSTPSCLNQSPRTNWSVPAFAWWSASHTKSSIQAGQLAISCPTGQASSE